MRSSIKTVINRKLDFKNYSRNKSRSWKLVSKLSVLSSLKLLYILAVTLP
jgi:hypothetical protein